MQLATNIFCLCSSLVCHGANVLGYLNSLDNRVAVCLLKTCGSWRHWISGLRCNSKGYCTANSIEETYFSEAVIIVRSLSDSR
jgi:hypothetical protein